MDVDSLFYFYPAFKFYRLRVFNQLLSLYIFKTIRIITYDFCDISLQ
jgi:hypothetical protein